MKSTLIRQAACFVLILALVSCSVGHVKQATQQPEATGSPDLCDVVSDKNRYMGEVLNLTGIYTTDFRHYALFDPVECETDNGLVVGRFASDEGTARREGWWNEHCGEHIATCEMRRTLTLQGRLVRREDGIYFDVIKVIAETRMQK